MGDVNNAAFFIDDELLLEKTKEWPLAVHLHLE
jgi:hypothetical protein